MPKSDRASTEGSPTGAFARAALPQVRNVSASAKSAFGDNTQNPAVMRICPRGLALGHVRLVPDDGLRRLHAVFGDVPVDGG